MSEEICTTGTEDPRLQTQNTQNLQAHQQPACVHAARKRGSVRAGLRAELRACGRAGLRAWRRAWQSLIASVAAVASAAAKANECGDFSPTNLSQILASRLTVDRVRALRASLLPRTLDSDLLERTASLVKQRQKQNKEGAILE